jgi:hypothetical protein
MKKEKKAGHLTASARIFAIAHERCYNAVNKSIGNKKITK